MYAVKDKLAGYSTRTGAWNCQKIIYIKGENGHTKPNQNSLDNANEKNNDENLLIVRKLEYKFSAHNNKISTYFRKSLHAILEK